MHFCPINFLGRPWETMLNPNGFKKLSLFHGKIKFEGIDSK